MDKWIGKTAVVTGASAGIGAQIVIDFAKKGINVIGLSRRPENVTKIAAELGQTSGKIYAYKCDVSDRDSVKEAFEWIEKNFKVVHILINNAGIGSNTNILSNNLDNGDVLDDIIKTNFSGLVHVTRHAFQLMKDSGDHGLIVNVNSIMGHRVPFPHGGKSVVDNVYHGTKHAVTATTEILRQELIGMGNRKIRVTSLSPGVVETNFFHNAKVVDHGETIADEWPALKSSDISEAIFYLLSTDYSVNVTELTVRPLGEPF